METRGRRGEERDEEGLHPWVLVVCLLLAATACLLLLSFTIRVMSEEPAKRISPAREQPVR